MLGGTAVYLKQKGTIVNFTNVANDAQVPRTTVEVKAKGMSGADLKSLRALVEEKQLKRFLGVSL